METGKPTRTGKPTGTVEDGSNQRASTLLDNDVRNMVLGAVYRRAPERRGAKATTPARPTRDLSTLTPAERDWAGELTARLRAAADREEPPSHVAPPKSRAR